MLARVAYTCLSLTALACIFIAWAWQGVKIPASIEPAPFSCVAPPQGSPVLTEIQRGVR